MSIEIRLYGDLKKHVSSKGEFKGVPNVIERPREDLENVSDVLKDLGISETEISHVFVNGDYSSLKRSVEEGDRVAIFPQNMGLIYKWYFRKSE